MGNRVAKHVYDASWNWEKSTFYVRDAQGNVMATYDQTESMSLMSYKVKERDIYGSSRLGMYAEEAELLGTGAYDTSNFSHVSGDRQYELSNHLGNVLAVVTDKVLPKDWDSDDTTDNYWVEMLSASDYYAFGAPMKGRSFTSNKYRYGFNGKENDPEANGTGNGTLDYGMRIYNPQLGRFLSIDPLTISYPALTPYQFASNTPIQATDLDEKEKIEATILVEYTTTKLRAVSGLHIVYDFNTKTVGVTMSAEGVGTFGVKVDLYTKEVTNILTSSEAINKAEIVKNYPELQLNSETGDGFTRLLKLGQDFNQLDPDIFYKAESQLKQKLGNDDIDIRTVLKEFTQKLDSKTLGFRRSKSIEQAKNIRQNDGSVLKYMFPSADAYTISLDKPASIKLDATSSVNITGVLRYTNQTAPEDKTKPFQFQTEFKCEVIDNNACSEVMSVDLGGYGARKIKTDTTKKPSGN